MGCQRLSIASQFPNLWFIENNATYRGFIGSDKDPSYYQAPFWQNAMMGRGVMGDNFRHYYNGIVKMGDTPSLLYLMGNGFNPDEPNSPHWGGQFEPMHSSPRFIVEGVLTEQDTIPVYSIMEWRLRGPVREDLARDSACLTLHTDWQLRFRWFEK